MKATSWQIFPVDKDNTLSSMAIITVVNGSKANGKAWARLMWLRQKKCLKVCLDRTRETAKVFCIWQMALKREAYGKI